MRQSIGKLLDLHYFDGSDLEPLLEAQRAGVA